MTLEDFKTKLELKYTGGMRFTTGASRRYHDSDMNIGAELHTPKKDGKWGKGEKIYYIGDSLAYAKSIIT